MPLTRQTFQLTNVLVAGRRLSGSVTGVDLRDAVRRFAAREARQLGADPVDAMQQALRVGGYRVMGTPAAARRTDDELVGTAARSYTDWPAMRESDDLIADRAALAQFERDIHQRYGPRGLTDFYTSISTAGDIHLHEIVVNPNTRGTGTGTAVLDELKTFAQSLGRPITLAPEAAPGKKAALDRFYRRAGFVPNRGRHRDYRLSSFGGPTMLWKPHVNEEKKPAPVIEVRPVNSGGSAKWTVFVDNREMTGEVRGRDGRPVLPTTHRESAIKVAQELAAQYAVTEALSPEETKQRARQVINQVYQTPGFDKRDRYNLDQVRVHAFNSTDTMATLGDDEADSDAVMDEVERLLTRAEDNLFQRRASRFARRKGGSAGDPVAQVRAAVTGKSWDEAKRALARGTPMGSHELSDEDAETLFHTVYNAYRGANFSAHAKYMSSHPSVWRLSDARDHGAQPGTGRDPEAEKRYAQTEIARNYFSGGVPELVTVYRGVPRPDVKIKPGDYCTLDRSMARGFMRGADGVVITQKLPARDLLVERYTRGLTELVYWPEGAQSVVSENPPQTLRQLWAEVNGVE